MKKTRITIKHQIEKSKHHFMVVNTEMLTSSKVDRIKKEMGVEMVFVVRLQTNFDFSYESIFKIS